MRLRIAPSAAAPIGCLATATRVFWGLVVDSPELHNGAWLSILLGLALAAPLLWGMQMAISQPEAAGSSGLSRLPRHILHVSVLLLALADGAGTMRCIADSASFLALDRTAVPGLMLPLYLAALWCLWRNGDAVGAAARIWLRLFPALLLIIVLLQLGYFRPEWLFPILGSGVGSIADGAVRTAGWISTLAGMAMLCQPEGEARPWQPVKTALLGCGAAALLVLLSLMISPTQVRAEGLPRTLCLDALLTNGRGPLYLQLPLILLWYLAMLNLIVYDCFLAAGLLQRLARALDGRTSAAIAVAAAAALSLSPLSRAGAIAKISTWQYAAIAIPGLATMLVALPGKEASRPCASAR